MSSQVIIQVKGKLRYVKREDLHIIITIIILLYNVSEVLSSQVIIQAKGKVRYVKGRV